MDYLVIATAALIVAALALYSGFGVGTLLMPVFALFFPIHVAVASTAVVHMTTNVFRMAIVGRRADWGIVWTFGLPAAGFAVVGAYFLVRMSSITPILTYYLGARAFDITTVKLVVAVLILAFAAFELVPSFQQIAFPRRWISVGGAVSGFFGGLSGHQGAFRSAILAKAGLDAGAFVGTASVCAFFVDVSRLVVYGITFFSASYTGVIEGRNMSLVAVAVGAAFVGTYASSIFLKQVTMQTIRRIVGALLLIIGFALGVGLV